MSSSFFLKDDRSTKKRKPKTNPKASSSSKIKGKRTSKTAGSPPKERAGRDDEEIPSDDDNYEVDAKDTASNLVFSSDECENETPQDKRLRLAKQYLEEIEKQEAERAEETKIRDHVSQRLQTDYLDSVGRLRRNIAASLEGYDANTTVTLKHKKHHLPICSVALSNDGKYLFSGAKTQFVLKWNLEETKIVGYFDVQPHTEDHKTDIKRRSHVIAMCLSSDKKFLALAEGGKNIQIWCPKELKHLKTFKGHRDLVTALVFRKDSHDLYSGSSDRSIKIWSLDEMAYIESLFGHQTGITGVDALSRERAISSGGSDCSVRIWKITEESQLIFNGPQTSIENVKYINDENFISSGADGSLCIWSALKKKPLCTELSVHGKQTNGEANWISAIASVVNTDLVASGSCDGFIRLWQIANNGRKLKLLLEIPMPGFVNCLAFNNDGTKLYAAVGQEHRLGRWWCIKEAKNKVVAFDLIMKSTKIPKSNS